MASRLILPLYVLATSVGLIAIKLGSKMAPPVIIANGRLQLHITAWSAIGVLLYGLSFLLYLYLIAKNDLGYIIPLTTALVYIIIFVASFLIFKEAFTAAKVLGIALIVGGLVLLNLKG